MAWSKKLTQLNDTLAELVPNAVGIEKYLRAAGLRPQMVSFNGNATDIWNSALSEADKTGKVNELVKAVLDKYPDDPYLLAALEEREINYSLAPPLDDISDWKGVSSDTLEILTGDISTMLPVAFLEKGVAKSRAVAKVEIVRGSHSDVGTGFLFKITGNGQLYFMTNYHVIPERAVLPTTRVIFNFELDTLGDSKLSKSFHIDENGPWYSSPVNQLDISVFKLIDPSGELEQFGFLELRPIDVAENDFVNIIQHPGGQMKQISLYHNVVTHCTDRIVQYLTDTLKGSSGAPVFNSAWDVIAIHHSGGEKRSSEPELPNGFKTRNEGIRINKIIDFLADRTLNNVN